MPLLSESYLHCAEFAGCLLTVPSGGDADALGTQALGAGSCERSAVAAAAVHRLRLPAPAKYTHVTKKYTRRRKKKVQCLARTESGVTLSLIHI